MHYSRLVGGLAALAVLLILLAAPVAGAASLTPVWSDDYTTSARRRLQCRGRGLRTARSTPPVFADATAPGAGGDCCW